MVLLADERHNEGKKPHDMLCYVMLWFTYYELRRAANTIGRLASLVCHVKSCLLKVQSTDFDLFLYVAFKGIL